MSGDKGRRAAANTAFCIALALMAYFTAGALAAAGAEQPSFAAPAARIVSSSAPAAPKPQGIETYARLIGQLSKRMVQWLGAATGYEVDDVLAHPPRLLFVRAPSRVDLGHGVLRIEPGMRGAYQQASDTILLVLPWHIADPLDRSVLLHELAHVVLVKHGTWRCYNETEWPAYELQQRWLAERGIEIRLDWIAIGAASRCESQGAPAERVPLFSDAGADFHACWMPGLAR